MPHAKDWMRYRGFGCPRAPIQLYGIDRCSWARGPFDRHRRLPSLHSATIFYRNFLLTRSNTAELEIHCGRALSCCKTRKKVAQPTRFEQLTFAFGGQRSKKRDLLDILQLAGLRRL